MIRKFGWQAMTLIVLVLGMLLYPVSNWISVFYANISLYPNIDRYILAVHLAVMVLVAFDWYLQREDWQKRLNEWLFMAGALLLSLALRLTFVWFESDDYLHNGYEAWLLEIKENGGFAALAKERFTPYTPVYLYFLAFFSYFPIEPIYAIKAIPIFFDYVAALAVFKIARFRFPASRWAYLVPLAFLFAPTVVLNGSAWAQIDIIYTGFLLWSFYFMLRAIENRERPFWGLGATWWVTVFFVAALTVKLQAMFFALPFLWFYLKRWISLPQISAVFLVVGLASILPAWLAGRPFMDIMLIYPRQMLVNDVLTLNAPTIYQLLPNAPFEHFHRGGLLVTVGVVGTFIYVTMERKVKVSADWLIWVAMLSTLMLPYFLPKMHDRYFFPADVFTILFAFWFPRYWWLPIGVGAISLMSYIPFLFDTQVFDFPVLSICLGALVAFMLKEFAQLYINNRKKQETDG